MAKNTLEVPSVLSAEKKIVVSDAYMYGTTWFDVRHALNANNVSCEPLQLVEKSVRGTISNRLKPAMQNDPAKLNAEVEKANLQKVDACSLNINQDTLKLVFTVKVLSGVDRFCACNSSAFAQSYGNSVRSYYRETGFKELAYRYAHNIANGRFLWRNYFGAEKIEVLVDVDGKNLSDDIHLELNAHDFSMRDFEHNSEIDVLADRIAAALSDEIPFLLIRVTAFAKMGAGQEVYPSEELVFDKGKSDKSKVLYQVNGTAAIHSQKIGNAIRTIDTWYPDFGTEAGVGPIPVDPYGAITTMGKAFRSPQGKKDFYTLFDKFAMGENLESIEDEHFVMSVMVRGGVFGKAGA